ncbi:MAG: TonB-dependent receptor, partial [Cyclobacteriaceae bacterium]
YSFNVISNYKHTRRVSSSVNVVFSSGRPVTYPTGKYQLGGIEVTNFADRNSFRLPNYFRIDVSLNVEGSHKINKTGHGYWSFSVYNLLARKNAYSIFFTNEGGTVKGYQLAVLGSAIPSVTYNVKF